MNNKLQKIELEEMFQMKFNDSDVKILNAYAEVVDDIESDIRVFGTFKDLMEWYYLDDKESMKLLINRLVNYTDNTSIADVILPDGANYLSNGRMLFNLDHYEV